MREARCSRSGRMRQIQEEQPGCLPSPPAGVYTFGSPRVGDESWAAAYERLGLAPVTLRCAVPAVVVLQRQMRPAWMGSALPGV